MGRLSRWGAAGLAAVAIGLIGAQDAHAFDGFGEATADSTYATGIRFEVELNGTPPDRLELLLRTPDSVGSFVAPVDPEARSATYVWDTSVDHMTPNTLVTFQWRATTGEDVTLGPEGEIRYEDDRPGLDWQQAQLGEATVHWYGDAEAQARHFGELTAVGVDRAEELLGTQLAGPVDVFVYANGDDFFRALGPGTREWTGAAAAQALRTIFMRLDVGADELDVTVVHEVTHLVFFDATANPYHKPARWLDEGIATWSESGDAADERSLVEFEANGGGLFSFEAITRQFPIGQRGALLSYAQGATMIDNIVDRYGPEAIARIAAAYRDGASDAEALEAGTGIGADDLYAEFFAEFGVEAPRPIAPDPIGPSSVERPPVGELDPGGVDGGPATAPPDSAPAPRADDALPLLVLLGAGGIAAIGAAVWASRRAARRAA